MVSEMSTKLPSLRCRTVSKCSMRSPRLILPRMTGSSSRRSTGMMIVIGLPTASSAVKPKSRSALLFQLRMTPLKSFDRIASSDELDNGLVVVGRKIVKPPRGLSRCRRGPPFRGRLISPLLSRRPTRTFQSNVLRSIRTPGHTKPFVGKSSRKGLSFGPLPTCSIRMHLMDRPTASDPHRSEAATVRIAIPPRCVERAEPRALLAHRSSASRVPQEARLRCACVAQVLT